MNNLFEIIQSALIFFLAISGLRQSRKIYLLSESLDLTDDNNEKTEEFLKIMVSDINENFITITKFVNETNKNFKLIDSENKQFNLRLNTLSNNVHKIDDKCKNSFLKVGKKLEITKSEDQQLFDIIQSIKYSNGMSIAEEKLMKQAKKNYKKGTYFIPVSESLGNHTVLKKSKNSNLQVVVGEKFNFLSGKLYAKTGNVTSHVIWDSGTWAEIIPSTNE
jgi:hypothetical protein